MQELDAILNQLTPRLSQWRRDFHHYAESGWVEFRTATIVAETLHQLGYQLALGRDVVCASARMGVPDEAVLAREYQRAQEQGALPQWLPFFEGGFTGIVATLDTGRPGPTLAWRVDMDALDLDESQQENHLPHHSGFGSCNPGMMHACAHDGHTAIGLGVATALKQLQSQLNGRIKLIFQPAEEGTRGAKAMTEAGVVDDVDYFIATHLGTGVPAGELVCGSNSFLATTKFDACFTGVAAHAGAAPECGRNALLAAAQAVLGLHSIAPHSGGASRVNVGVLQGGSGRNVIPGQAVMKVETRGATNDINEYVWQRAQAVVKAAAEMYDVEVGITLMGAAQSSEPSPGLVRYVHQQATQIPELTSVVDSKNAPAGSEDATFMMERVKAHGGQATYVIFGCDLSAGHHNEKFDFDEQVLAVAVKTHAMLACNFPWKQGIPQN